ncbi:MAG: NADH:ubiquinone oxidoreductase subunit NDUFA12 [Alphaproteobacteria bacterium]|nr:NADH:ubiquinone oxidoreductase subunit NDUFA12 [Alphaproteobacteria bacterium]
MKKLFKFFSILSPAHITFFTMSMHKEKIGTDSYGNDYYEARPRKSYKLSRRWVMYADNPKAGYVPPEWHGWLHHQTDIVPEQEDISYHRPEQKPPLENMTGTNKAYYPAEHMLSDKSRVRVCGDYEAWTPPK